MVHNVNVSNTDTERYLNHKILYKESRKSIIDTDTGDTLTQMIHPQVWHLEVSSDHRKFCGKDRVFEGEGEERRW